MQAPASASSTGQRGMPNEPHVRPVAKVVRLDLAELDELINASIIEPEGNPAEQDNGGDMQ